MRRLVALSLVADGMPIVQVAQRVGVDRVTVQRWLSRYVSTGRPEGLRDAPRLGRPRKVAWLGREELSAVLCCDPRDVGYQATTWTVPLLVGHLRRLGYTLSQDTLRRRMHEHGWRWKRPRYVFHQRDPHVGQKKGRLSVA